MNEMIVELDVEDEFESLSNTDFNDGHAKRPNELEANGGVGPNSAYFVLVDSRGRLDIGGRKLPNMCWVCSYSVPDFLALLDVSSLDLRDEMMCIECRAREAFEG